jgi:hypothetical protein
MILDRVDWGVILGGHFREGHFEGHLFCGRERPSHHLLLWKSVFNNSSYLALEDNGYRIHSESWHMLVEPLVIDLKYLKVFVENEYRSMRFFVAPF